MRAPRSLTFRIVAATLCVMLAGFTVLSADVIVRVWLMRGQMESAVDAAILLSYEAARTLTTALALGLALASWRRANDVTRRVSTLLVLFLGLWYTKTFAFAAFPGHLQEGIAGWLFANGVPRGVSAFIFGEPAWAAWLALGALLRLSIDFPARLDAGAIEQSGRRDRTGLLRGVSLAGLDVGRVFRHAARALLQRGALGPVPVWLGAATAGSLHALTNNAIVRAVLGGLCVMFAMVAVTNLRATMVDAPAAAKRRVWWMLQAAIVAVSAFATSALLSAAGGRFPSGVSFGLGALAPPAVLMGLACAITRRNPPNPQPAIRRTLLLGIAVTAAAAVYVLSVGLIAGLARPTVATALAVAVATGCTVLLRSSIRRVVGRISASAATQA